MFGLYVKFRAHAGQRDKLIDLLLKASTASQESDGCYLYVVNSAPDDPQAVWVTEIWRSQADQEASLSDEATKALITSARPLIEDVVQRIEVVPLGGKGLPVDQ